MVFKKIPRLEFIIIAVFFLGFLLWAVPKCSATKDELNPPSETSMVDSLDSESEAEVAETESPAAETPPAQAVTSSTGNSNLSRLFVTIDKLKLRKGPALDSAVVMELPLFDEVYFLNEVTDFKTKLNLGMEEAEEPWVKIKTRSGQTGWVYGAGVNYYKKKTEGVLE